MGLVLVISFIVFLLAVLALATGLIISGKAIKGSCGGLNCELCTGKSKKDSWAPEKISCGRLNCEMDKGNPTAGKK